MRIKLAFGLVLLSHVWMGGFVCSGQDLVEVSTNVWQTRAIASGADLDRVITQLQSPATRFDAFLALLDFAGYTGESRGDADPMVAALHTKAYNAICNCPGSNTVVATMIARLKQPDDRLSMLAYLLKFSAPYDAVPGMHTGNRSLDDLMKPAAEAANAAFDPPTVQAALTNSDWLLRISAVNHFGNPPPGAAEWEPLLPQIEKLAVTGDASIRGAADEKLEGFPGTEKFLDERLTNETSAEVIMDLLRDRHDRMGKEFDDRFLSLFVPLLSNPDKDVRDDALIFIGFNSQRAPVLQFTFGMDVFDRVVAETRAKSARERAAAAYALTDIRQLDPARSREAFLRLANDPDEDVRWRVAWGLKSDLERDDVKRAIAMLLQDKSPDVRYMTILAAGAPKFVPQLQELSQGPDPIVAEWARETLKQVADEKRN